MKKVVGKNGQKVTVFNKYDIENMSCPECNRPFKEADVKDIMVRGTISCPKCGSKLIKK